MAELHIEVSKKEEIERFICIVCLGIVEAIQCNILSAHEITYFFAAPYSAHILEKKYVDKEILIIINLLCELEDVERLIPDKFNISLDDTKERILKFMSSISKPQLPQKYWIQKE